MEKALKLQASVIVNHVNTNSTLGVVYHPASQCWVNIVTTWYCKHEDQSGKWLLQTHTAYIPHREPFSVFYFKKNRIEELWVVEYCGSHKLMGWFLFCSERVSDTWFSTKSEVQQGKCICMCSLLQWSLGLKPSYLQMKLPLTTTVHFSNKSAGQAFTAVV